MSCVRAAADSCETCQRKDTTAIIRQNDLIECHACWTERYRRVFGISVREATRYSYSNVQQIIQLCIKTKWRKRPRESAWASASRSKYDRQPGSA